MTQARFGRLRIATPAIATVLGAVVVALLVVFTVLTILSSDLRVSADGTTAVLALAFAGVGLVVARHQPGNPIGWIMLGCAVATALAPDARLYLVLDHRLGHSSLPFGTVAVFWVATLWPLPFLVGTPALLLFPDGRLPSPRWRWTMRAYLGASALWLAGQAVGAASTIAGHRIGVDAGGNVTTSPTGVADALYGTSWLFAALLPVIWLAWVGRLAVTYRGASGERREQLKWLSSGAAICVIALVVTVVEAASNSVVARVATDVSHLAIAALPVSMGVAILKYRLYDIDRIISRTLAYAVVTGLLIGVYAGLVLLTTQVFRVHTPVAVAASTLAAAALFNPVRRRVQRAVDRRFNRARYNADQTVAAFAARLQDAVDLDSVRDELAGVVHRALEPAHASVWIIRRD